MTLAYPELAEEQTDRRVNVIAFSLEKVKHEGEVQSSHEVQHTPSYTPLVD